ncbi:MAG: RNA polymerase sigma factor [Anaerolineales bacterium]|nr:RNA polymerase sigma factor [Anaerolineales bacterium]MCB0007922.1 RNA polymerase sigma factor [Anaerolineales bacterium]
MKPAIELEVRRFQQGDLEAFTRLFERYQDRVYDLACIILRDEAAAQDVVQDTFLTVFQKAHRFRGDAAFETWLLAIAVNQCRGRLRRQKIRKIVPIEKLNPLRWLRGSGDNPLTLIEEKTQRENLWRLVDELPDRLRLPVILRYRSGLTCEEIAAVLKKKRSTVYQALHEGRTELQKKIALQPSLGAILQITGDSS